MSIIINETNSKEPEPKKNKIKSDKQIEPENNIIEEKPIQTEIKSNRNQNEIEKFQEVLAQWPEDGWFYKAKVKAVKPDSKNRIQVEFMFERTLKIDVKNVVMFPSSTDNLLEEDKVLALFPNYRARYAPGVIYKVANNYSNNYLISFYDYTLKDVSKENIVRIDSQFYEQHIKYIKEMEKCWIGKTVVALSSKTANYEIAQVIKQSDSGRRYLIEFLNQTQEIQSSNHIFGPIDKKIRISSEPKQVQDFVLAPYEQNIYKPGIVKTIQENLVTVQFTDGTL